MAIFKFSKNHDIVVTINIFILSIISLILIFATTYNATTTEGGVGTFKKQILFFIVGFFIYFLISSINISYLRQLNILLLLFLITLFLLIYVKLFAIEIAGTKRWIKILGFSIQPAEYAKITIIILASAILTSKHSSFAHFIKFNTKTTEKITFVYKTKKIISLLDQKYPKIKKIVLTLIISTPLIFLVFIQPAFGNSIIMAFLVFAIIFASIDEQLKLVNFLIPIIVIPLSYWKVLPFLMWFEELNLNLELFNINITLLILIFLITGLFSLKSKLPLYFIIISVIVAQMIKPSILFIWNTNILTDYQKQRIETYFQSPENDPLNAGYQVRQSKIAIGAGRLFGRGFLQGTQSTLQVLPFAYTDFIFASLAEQFGLIGASILFALYITIFIRLLNTATNLNDTFGVLIISGVIIMMLLNIFINIGMNLGKLPVTGIPLPLVSYGGSSVLVNMIGLGLTQAVRANIKPKDIAESFTIWK